MGSHHDHDHAHIGAGQGKIAIAAIITGLFMIAEVAGGLISGSLALLADAGHMLTDFAALSLAWFAYHLAKRPANSNLTFGYERFPVLAAFVNGLSLFAIALWIVVEAFWRAQNPGEILAGTMFWVAVLGLIVNVIVFFILRSSDEHNLNIKGAMLHVLGDMLGSAAAIIAALIIMRTGLTIVDPLLSVFVALLILRSAWYLIKDSGHILLQGAPDGLNRDEICDRLVETVKGVDDIEHMHIWSLTDGRPVMTMEVNPDASTDPKVIDKNIRKCLADDFEIDHVTIQVNDYPHQS